MIYKAWEVVVVPFPFTDRLQSKKRPALVMSQEAFNKNGHTILAMITTATHSPSPGDTLIRSLGDAGLRKACIVRLKLFTLDNRLILRSIGRLGKADVTNVTKVFRKYVTSRST